MTPKSPRISYQQPPQPVQLPPIPIILPERQEFRVVEYVKDDKIVKVQLEMRTHYFNENGIFIHSEPWAEVERVQIDMSGT